jgi:signal transduction histidine kinase
MRKLIDKLVVFVAALALYVPGSDPVYMVVPILTALIITAVLSYVENEKIILSICAAYLLLCLFRAEFLFFIPLLCYDAAFLTKKDKYWLLSFLPLVVQYTALPLPFVLLTAALTLAALVLKYRTVTIENMEKDYRKLRDTATEISIQLEQQNKELLEKQDYEVHLATITERNRIARDIHDNVGHLLSRSILQVGALLAINKDNVIAENLKLVKDTLSEAMDSIRASVHDLHENSIDLKTEIQKLIDGFSFCPIVFHYDMDTDLDGNLDKNMKYCFIAVIKEALSNILKHSNAANASVTICEHPALYQLIIKDNGTKGSYDSENGIGIKNISDRVTSLGGNINISTENGFRIFISIPKKL